MSPHSELRSLYDMLQINAEHFVEAGRKFEGIKQICRRFKADVQFGREDMLQLREIVAEIQAKCHELQLITTEKIVDELSTECKGEHITVARLHNQMYCVETCFRAELQSKLFFYVPNDRAAYFSDGTTCGKELQSLCDSLKEKFPDAISDLYEAGNCFAAGRYTACVSHLSKVVEFGLVSLADYAEIEDKHRKFWNKVLEMANGKLRDQQGRFASITPEDNRYFSEAIGLLRNFKVAWRNPSSHIPITFNEPKARGLFSIAKSTMEHLAKRLKQVNMAPETYED